MSYAGLGQAPPGFGQVSDGRIAGPPLTTTTTPSSGMRSSSLILYGMVGLGALIGAGTARLRGKSWSTTIGYGVLGGTLLGGGTVYYAIRNIWSGR